MVDVSVEDFVTGYFVVFLLLLLFVYSIFFCVICYVYPLIEYSGSFEDVSSNTVICFQGIPKEFRGNMTVLSDAFAIQLLYSHCCYVNNKSRYAFANTYL